MAAAKKPRKPKAETPHSELHGAYVDAILRGMWDRTTGLQAMQGMFAARLSLSIRQGKMPLPDDSMPTPADVERIVRKIRGNGRGFTIALVAERWQRACDEMVFGSPPVGEASYRQRPDTGFQPISADDLR